MQAGVHEYFSAQLPWVNQIINIVSLYVIEFVHQVKEGGTVDDQRRNFTTFLAQVIGRESLYIMAK